MRPDRCSLCSHATNEPPAEAVAAQARVNRALWRARHVDSGAMVYCPDWQEAEAHVRESASGPWVAERCVMTEHSPSEAGCDDECTGLCGEHHWLDRPESDTRECLICGVER